MATTATPLTAEPKKKRTRRSPIDRKLVDKICKAAKRFYELEHIEIRFRDCDPIRKDSAAIEAAALMAEYHSVKAQLYTHLLEAGFVPELK